MCILAVGKDLKFTCDMLDTKNQIICHVTSLSHFSNSKFVITLSRPGPVVCPNSVDQTTLVIFDDGKEPW